jgi:1,4-dihydroxy-2-naphthoyl-CoA synthase
MSVYQDAYFMPEFKYEYNKLNVEVRGPIHVVAFNDAANLNAMSYEQMAEFNDYLKKVRMDPDCRAIVLTGEGRAFCAGFNLNDLNLEPPVEEGMGRAQRDYYIMQTICSDPAVNMRACPQVIIGALKGFAIGGGLAGAGETILGPVRKILDQEDYARSSSRRTRLVKAKLGNDAGIIGAALQREFRHQ